MKSWLEISRARLEANVRALREAAGAGVELLAVIKADAYGHAAETVAPLLAAAGVSWMGVTDVEEGARIRARLRTAREGDATRLLVMLGPEPEDADGIVAHRLTPVVWTVEQIAALERAARIRGERLRVHVEVETGMARQGAASGAELATVLDALRAAEHVELEGLMTHLCSSEAAGSGVTAVQRGRFDQAIAQVEEEGLRPRWLHMGNTSAVDAGDTMGFIREAAARLGATPLVRCGYGLYGYAMPLTGSAPASAEPQVRPRLAPVLRWTTRVLSVRELQAGDGVGYGQTFVAQGPMRVALLPVGYADGFRRAASSGMGNGWVSVRGERAAVLGRVSMNQTVVDVTHIPGVNAGDEVVLLGDSPTAEDHARWAGTIGYEILCGLRGNVRVG